jgi:hypothetical protein
MVLTKGKFVLLKVTFNPESFKVQLQDVDCGGVQARAVGSAVAGGNFHLIATGVRLADAMRDPVLYIPFSQIQWVAEYGE